MKKFATKMYLQKQQMKRRQETREYDVMPNDMLLPDFDTIRHLKPNQEAIALNAELLEYDNEIPEILGNSAAI